MKAERELARAAENLFLEFSQDGGVHNFFEVVKNTPRIGDLPPMYLLFFFFFFLISFLSSNELQF